MRKATSSADTLISVSHSSALYSTFFRMSVFAWIFPQKYVAIFNVNVLIFFLLCSFEESLRRVDPSTSLPYWDSTLDDAIPNPVNSILWTSELFGNGVGDVTSGPAANWVTHQGRLQRNYGQFSRLMSKENLSNVLSRCRLKVSTDFFLCSC